MCGFIAWNEGGLQHRNIAAVIKEMDYRGLPEYQGSGRYGRFSFGHVSLPFTNLDPEVAIQPIYVGEIPSVFVGEIFNWEDLNNEFLDWKVQSDAQFFVRDFHFHNYGKREINLDYMHKYDGFWSFATVIDDKLFACADYLSQKPVYYRTDLNVVASEIDVLKNLKNVTRNELFHSNVLKWGYDPNGLTPWEEIKQIPPGHYYLDGEIFKYWNWDFVSLKGYNSLRDVLKESVKNRLTGEREVAVLLSGGLDSTIIYRLIREIQEEYIEEENSITAIHVENGESHYAELVTKDLINITFGEISDEKAIEIHQTPVDLGSVKPQIAMAEELKKLGFHAVMTGDGADELFGGYKRAKEYDSQYSDIFLELPYYHLPKLDRTMMRSTIELRAPFLSPKVVKYALDVKYENRNGEKKILKSVFEDLVPQNILLRDKEPLKTPGIKKFKMGQRLINEEIWKEKYNG